jgi:hypothetical protein
MRSPHEDSRYQRLAQGRSIEAGLTGIVRLATGT